MKHFIRQAIQLSIAIIFTISCVTRGSSKEYRPAEEIENLKISIEAKTFKPCENNSAIIKLPVPIRDAKLIWHENKPVLIYEGLFQQSMKTIWQPLTENFELSGDGVAVGQRGMPHVTDFQTTSDELEGFWTSYRFKIPQSEIYAAAVEYLAKTAGKNDIVRLGMPQNRDSTVQRVWLLPLPEAVTPPSQKTAQQGIAHIIVKTVSTKPDSIESTESVYTWYLLHATKNIVRKMGEYREPTRNLFLENFFLSPDATDPLAVAISNENRDFNSSKGGGRQKSRILSIRPFAPNAPSELLHEDNRTLSAFTARSFSRGEKIVRLAWLREPIEGANPEIYHISVPLAVPKSNALQKKHSKKVPYKSPIAQTIKTNYSVSQLEFVDMYPTKGQPVTALTWWGGVDPNLAFVISPLEKPNTIIPQTPKNGGGLLAFISRENIGTPFSAVFNDRTEKNSLSILYSETARGASSPTPGKLVVCSIPRAATKN